MRAGLGLADRPEDAAARFEEALALWRGRPYAEFADEEFAPAEVARLEELRLCAVEEHAGAAGRAGSTGRGDRRARGRDRGGAVPRAAARRVDAGVGACGPPGRGAARVRRLPPLPRRRGGRRSLGRRSKSSTTTSCVSIPTSVGSARHDRRGGRRAAERHGDVPVHRSRGLDPPVAGASRRHGRGAGPPRRDPARRGRVARRSDRSRPPATASTRCSPTRATRSTPRSRPSVALQAEPWGETGPLRVRMGVHTGSSRADATATTTARR